MTEYATRSISIGGDVRQSVLVTGDQVQVAVGVPGAAPEELPAFRILTCIARPLDSRELADVAEARALAEALAFVQAPVYMGFVCPPTREALQARLQEAWDVFHFDGHGTAEDGGALLLEDEDGLSAPLPAADLADLLRRCRLPKLLILSACESAKPLSPPGREVRVRPGLAGHLLQTTGVGAVIGFRDVVSIDITRQFLLPLYAALGAGRTIRQAFEAARAALPKELRDLPVLLGDGVDEPLTPPGRRGTLRIERAPLYGVPAPAEFRFYGDFLPGDPPGGRKGLLCQVVRHLRRGERFLVLHGAGGIGKSALAALAAERLAAHFPGGVFWADGAAYLDRGMNPDAALEPFAAVLGGEEFLKLPWTVKWQRVKDRARDLAAPVLWILDNADVADDPVWRMARELPEPSAVLLTTREKPEWGGRVLPVGPLTEGEAARLLWTEAVRRRDPAQPPLGDDPATLEALEEIARLLEGHPLALLVAAALVADEGPREALAAVRANPARGETARRFDFSFCRLPEPERQLLLRLTPFAGDFGMEAVEALAPTPGSGEGVRDLLRELARRSFLTPTPLSPLPLSPAVGEGEGPGEGVRGPRYRLHPVLRAYLRAKIPDAEYADHAWAMARYYLPRAGEAHAALNDPGRARRAVAWAAAERLNLLAAQDTCREQGRRGEAVALAYALNDLFERSGHRDLRRQAIEVGRAAAQPDRPRDYAALTHNLGILAQAQGDYPAARRLYNRAAEVFRELGALREQATILHQLGMLAQDQGDYPEARRLYEESLRIEEQLGNRAGVAKTLHQLGVLAHAQGDYPEARRLYNQAAEVFRELGALREQAAVLHQLGVLAQDQGDYPEARQLYEESLRIEEQLGDRAGVAKTLHQLGMLAQDQGDYPEARRLYEESLRIKEGLGDRAGLAQTLHNLGALAQAQGDYPEARRLYEESLRIAEQLGDRWGIAASLGQLGRVAELEGDYHTAIQLWARALATFEELGTPEREIVLRWFARLRERMGKKKFERLLREALGKPAPE